MQRFLTLLPVLVMSAVIYASNALAQAPDAGPVRLAQRADPPQQAQNNQARALLRDNRPASALNDAQLNQRIGVYSNAVRRWKLSRQLRGQLQQRLRSYIGERSRRSAAKARNRNKDRNNARNRDRNRDRDNARNRNRNQDRNNARNRDRNRDRNTPPGRTSDQNRPEIRALLNDRRPSSSLNDAQLRQRMQRLTAGLQSGLTSRGVVARLRAQLRSDRQELSRRAAQRRNRDRDNARGRDRNRDRDNARDRDRNRDRNRDRGRDSADRGGADARALLGDRRPASRLNEAQLRQRISRLAAALRNSRLRGPIRQRLQRKLEGDRNELRSRTANRRDRDRDRGRDRNRDRDRDRDRDNADRGGDAAQARALLGDRRASSALNDDQLRQRLRRLRSALRNRGLPGILRQRLRRRLENDRRVLRERIAARRDRGRDRAGDRDSGRDRGRDRNRERGRDRVRDRDRPDARASLRDRRPSAELNRRQLLSRIRALREALRADGLTPVRRSRLARRLAGDRAELRRRLRARRVERRRTLRRDRSRLRREYVIVAPNQFNRYRDVPAAEADEGIIRRQLLAPPRRKFERRYTLDDVRTNQDLRRRLPGLEVDTIRFAFDSDEIAPEEIAKLERVGQILERILTARPGEVYLLEGHTDLPGTDEYNLDLSQRRAEAVKRALQEYFVIPGGALEIAGFGEKFPRIPTTEPEVENRRVTVRRVTSAIRGDEAN